MHRRDAEDAEIISLRFGGLNVSEPSHPKVEHSLRLSAGRAKRRPLHNGTWQRRMHPVRGRIHGRGQA